MATIWTDDFSSFADGFVLSDSVSWTRRGVAELQALSGKFYQNTTGGSGGVEHARTGDATTDGEYFEATFDVKSLTGDFGIGVRMSSTANSGYFFMHIISRWRIYVLNSGTYTQLRDMASTLATGTRTFRIKVTGTSGDPVIETLYDGVNPWGSNYTHSSGGTKIYTLGRAGFYSSTSVTSTTGLHVDSATYEDGGGGGGGGDATANGVTVTAAASLIAGSASGAASSTASGVTLTAAASLIAGSASGVANGTLNFQAAGMEFGARTGLGIGTFALEAGVNYRYTIHADGGSVQAPLHTSATITLDSAGKLPNYVGSAVTPGTTYRICAVRQSDGEAAIFRMVAS